MKTAACCLLAALAGSAVAAPFEGADTAAGARLHAQHCVSCHEQKWGGEEGSAIYLRPDHKVRSASALASQITTCTTMLGLDLFPEDENDIGGYLNTRYYHFE